MNIKVKSGPVLSAILIAILTFSFTTAAVAANPPCGCNIIQDTTLEADMTCEGTAITIGADNIVLDCAGRSITGTGIGSGIFLSGRTGVTIKNCVVTKFSNGINLASSSKNILTSNTVSSNYNGIYLTTSSNYNTLTGNTASGNTGGFGIFESTNNTLDGNIASNNMTGIGLVYLSNDNNITNNKITASGTIGTFGILFTTGSNRNTINKNTINYNTSTPNPGIVGIKVSCDGNVKYGGSSDNTITDNTITMNQLNLSKWSQGIRIVQRSNNNKILNNNITVNGGANPSANPNVTASIRIASSSNNRIMDNNLTTNNLITIGSSGYGVYLSEGLSAGLDDDYWSEGSNYNTVSGNTITAVDNSGVGIRLDLSSNNTLTSNNINANNYGVSLDASSNNNILTGNTVNSSFAPSINLASSSGNTIYRNNIIGTFLPKVSSDAAVELSYGGSGNFWDRTTEPYFVVGVDSNRPDVKDSYPYSALNGWPPPAPPANYEPITGNPEVDAAMGVLNNKYTDPETGLATHGTYVSAVTNKIVEMRMAGKITKEQGGEIVKKAAQSSVNMP